MHVVVQPDPSEARARSASRGRAARAVAGRLTVSRTGTRGRNHGATRCPLGRALRAEPSTTHEPAVESSQRPTPRLARTITRRAACTLPLRPPQYHGRPATRRLDAPYGTSSTSVSSARDAASSGEGGGSSAADLLRTTRRSNRGRTTRRSPRRSSRRSSRRMARGGFTCSASNPARRFHHAAVSPRGGFTCSTSNPARLAPWRG